MFGVSVCLEVVVVCVLWLSEVVLVLMWFSGWMRCCMVWVVGFLVDRCCIVLVRVCLKLVVFVVGGSCLRLDSEVFVLSWMLVIGVVMVRLGVIVCVLWF